MTTLYRKWRPQTFAEVRGQERVVRTLQNALGSGRIGHAYLFTGPRGVGKTTTARLLAKALNCLHDGGAGETPTIGSAILPEPYLPGEPIPAEPDNSCWVCRDITAGASHDIVEIDAASTGRVDDVRDLRDKVASVGSTRYKFYILDEAHQMTKDAFDALLKTLEEPPPRVVFVLATTDAAKLPPTVLSRCQRFDFRRISVADIRASLSDICAAEGIDAEPAALEVLARAADGSSRDSQSLLDQAIAFCGSSITLAGVRSMLGLASADSISRLAEALLAADARTGLELINEATDAGVDPRGLNRELVDHLRSLLLIKVGSGALDVSPEDLPALRGQAEGLSAPALVRQIKIFSEADYGFRSALQAQLPLELAFLQAIDTAVEAPAPPARAAAPVTPARQPQPSMAPESSPPARAAAPVGPAQPPQAPPTEPGHAPGPVGPAQPPPAPKDAQDEPAEVAAPRQSQTADAGAAGEPAGVHMAAETKAEWTAPETQGGDVLQTIVQRWPAVLQAVRTERKTAEALLRSCTPVAMEGETVTLACDGEFHARELSKPENKRLVEASISRAVGQPCYVTCVVRDKKAEVAKPGPSAGLDATKPDDNDPLVRAALRMLNARVLENN
jgi:DNA polymerase-3 subunit gamma/tau